VITVRPMEGKDVDAVKDIHSRMGIDYKLPRLKADEKGPIETDFSLVVEQDGQIIGASLNRVVAETYLLIDPTLKPHDKLTAIRMGHRMLLAAAKARGWREFIAMIPTEVVLRFEKRLKQLGWEADRTGWHLWSRSVQP